MGRVPAGYAYLALRSQETEEWIRISYCFISRIESNLICFVILCNIYWLLQKLKKNYRSYHFLWGPWCRWILGTCLIGLIVNPALDPIPIPQLWCSRRRGGGRNRDRFVNIFWFLLITLAKLSPRNKTRTNLRKNKIYAKTNNSDIIIFICH